MSAVNGCGKCVTAHEKILRQHEVGREAVQSAVRIASVIHAVAGVIDYENARAACPSPLSGEADSAASPRILAPASWPAQDAALTDREGPP